MYGRPAALVNKAGRLQAQVAAPPAAGRVSATLSRRSDAAFAADLLRGSRARPTSLARSRSEVTPTQQQPRRSEEALLSSPADAARSTIGPASVERGAGGRGCTARCRNRLPPMTTELTQELQPPPNEQRDRGSTGLIVNGLWYGRRGNASKSHAVAVARGCHELRTVVTGRPLRPSVSPVPVS